MGVELIISERLTQENDLPFESDIKKDLYIEVIDNGFVRFGNTDNELIFFLTNEEIEMLHNASQTALRESEREARMELAQGV